VNEFSIGNIKKNFITSRALNVLYYNISVHNKHIKNTRENDQESWMYRDGGAGGKMC